MLKKCSAGQLLFWIEFMPWNSSRLFSFPYSFLPLPPVSRYPHVTYWFPAFALGPEKLNCSWSDKNSNPLSFTSLAGLPASLAQIALPAFALSVSHAAAAAGHTWRGFAWLLWRNAFTDGVRRDSESHRLTQGLVWLATTSVTLCSNHPTHILSCHSTMVPCTFMSEAGPANPSHGFTPFPGICGHISLFCSLSSDTTDTPVPNLPR